MSRSCAERCNLLRLMDDRFKGMAVGVGSATILGKIHMVQLKAGDHYLPVSITVLDQVGSV
jgi:DNA damage-inducible protein 1